MNILQIATAFPGWGGTEIHLLNLSRQLTMRGHTVTIACMPGKWVESRAAELGLETVPFHVMKQHDWTDFGAIRKFIRERRIDVVHAHWNTDILVPALAATLERVPVRILSRHSPNPFRSTTGGKFYGNFIYSRVVTVSESVRRTMIASGVAPDRVITIHHGTDVAEFQKITMDPVQTRAELGIPQTALAVGILGRVASEKGHKYLFDALKTLNDIPELRLVVVGGGPIYEETRAYVTAEKLDDRVIWVPFRSDVNNVINALDIVTVPSIWEEPCSAVIQQGMALSKPVLGTKVGGTPEMIVDGETGLLVAPESAAELAAAIRTLSDGPLRQRMGQAGVRRVTELFSLQHMTDRIEELYRRELARTGMRHTDAVQSA